MSEQITITIADAVYDLLHERMKQDKKTNRSEYIEELIRRGL